MFDLKIVSKSQRHRLQKLFFNLNAVPFVPIFSSKSDSSFYNRNFDALFILAPFDFLQLAPAGGPGSASIEQLSFDPPLSGDIYKDTQRQIEFCRDQAVLQQTISGEEVKIKNNENILTFPCIKHLYLGYITTIIFSQMLTKNL